MIKIGLRNKIMIGIIILILTLGVSVMLFLRMTLKQKLLGDFRKKGIAIGISLALRSADPILAKDSGRLTELLAHEKEREEDVAYAFLVAADKETVLAHTFEKEALPELVRLNLPDQRRMYSIKELPWGRSPVFDIAAPVIEDKALIGYARIGVSQKKINGTIGYIMWNLLGITVLIMLVGTLVAYRLADFITKPISKLVEVAKMTGRGDLTPEIKTESSDEIGELSDAFNKMVSNLRRLVVQIKGVDQELTSAANLIKTQAEGTRAIAEQGSRRVLGLGEKSKSIEEIINVINELSDHTNLLALNSSIEAARAGESGKGFGVVASEVRKLAERSLEESEEIARLLNEIRSETNTSVLSSEEITKRVDEFTFQAKKLDGLAEDLMKAIGEFKLG